MLAYVVLSFPRSILQPVPSVLHPWQVLRLQGGEGLDVQLLEMEGWIRTS